MRIFVFLTILLGSVACQSRSYPTDLTDVGAWTSYFTYVGLVAGIPWVFGGILMIVMMLGCCFSCCCWAPYARTKHLVCGVLFGIEYAVVLIATIVAWVFVIVATVSSDSITSSGLDLADGLLDLPQSFGELTGLFTTVTGEISGILTDPLENSIEPALRDLQLLVNDTRDAFNLAPPFFDSMYNHFESIKSSGDQMVTAGPPFGLIGPFSWVGYSFPNRSTAIPPSSLSALDGAYDTITDGLNAIAGVRDMLNMSLGLNGTEMMGDTMGQVEETLADGLSMVEEVIGMSLTSVMTNVRSGVTAGSVSSAVIFSLVYAFLAVVVGFAPCCFFKKTACNGHCLRCMACLACVGVWFHVCLASIFIPGYFVISDLCSGVESTLVAAADIPEITFELPLSLDDVVGEDGNSSALTINIADGILSVLTCGQPDSGVSTYLDALGLDLGSLLGGNDSILGTLGDDLLGDVDFFNVSGVDDEMSSLLDDFGLSVSDAIPDDYLNQINLLGSEKDAQKAKWPQFTAWWGLNLTNETNLYTSLNALIDTNNGAGGGFDVDRSNIRLFDPLVAPWDGAAWIPADDTEAMTVLKPQLEELLTISESPILTQMWGNITYVDAQFDLLNASFLDVAGFTTDLETIGPRARVLLDILVSLVDDLLDDALGIPAQILDTLESEIGGLSMLQCDSIGSLYTAVQDEGCGMVIPAMGVVGALSMVIAVTFFLLFWSLIYVGMLLIDFEKNGEHKERRYGDHDRELSDIEMSDDPDYMDDYRGGGGGGGGMQSRDTGPKNYPRHDDSSGSNGSGDDYGMSKGFGYEDDVY